MRYILITYFLTCSLLSYSQQKPKLVVGIVVDQMKQEYLYRFKKNYSDNGFMRLVNGGAEMKNVHYNYVPTYTGPGHASIYTGTTPFYHGIIGNNWYSRREKRDVYCVDDFSVNSVGTNSDHGKASPQRLLTTTITDALKLSTQMESKVISLSIKDRGAILPAGHTGQAYWYDYSSGNFITSSFYRNELPKWLITFNAKKLADHYLSGSWDRLLPEESYFQDQKEYRSYEKVFEGMETPDFPYDLKKLKKTYGYEILPKTPFGNDILTSLVSAAIDGENLGSDNVTDFLAISFSSTDIIGHDFGPQSQELEDTYYRLDKNIASIIDYLDEKVGKDQYLLFLTADHAVADVPLYMNHQKMPGGKFRNTPVRMAIDSVLTLKYNIKNLVNDISNDQVYLDREKIIKAGIELQEAQDLVADYLITSVDHVAYVWTARTIKESAFDERGLKGLIVRGYHQKISGDVIFAPFPGWFSGSSSAGTTHGSPFTYDTHVPLIWYGLGIKTKSSVQYYEITDIASTLSFLLDIRLPNGNIGQPITELFED